MNNLYNNDSEFREYVDKYAKLYNKSTEEVLNHKIIKNVGEYYKKGGKHTNDYITIKN